MRETEAAETKTTRTEAAKAGALEIGVTETKTSEIGTTEAGAAETEPVHRMAGGPDSKPGKGKIQLSDHFSYGKLLRFVMPSIIMMVFTSIYGVVDGLFVSNFVGKTSFAAINLIMPLLMIFGGIGFMLGTGGSALVAKTLGEGKKEQAKRYFTMMVYITLIIGIAVSVIGIVVMEPVAVLLGADEAMLPECVLYGRITMIFNVSFMLQNVFQSFLITAEKPKLGLAATVAAGLTNMMLDALFIGIFRWGVAGAALATGLSQCVGGIIPLVYFICPNTSLLRLTKTRLESGPILRACGNGVSEMVSNVTASVVGMRRRRVGGYIASANLYL